MKYQIQFSTRFSRDLKLAVKRGKDLSKLQAVVDKLANGDKLDEQYRDHNLTGKYAGFRECHIQPDWLLVYRIDNTDIILFLSRTGSHADLF